MKPKKFSKLNKKLNKRKKHSVDAELIRILNILLNNAKKKRRKGKPEANLEKILEGSKEKLRRFDEFIPKESYHVFMHERNDEKERISVKYNVDEEDSGYSVAIDYENNGREERLQIKGKSTDEKEKYAITITKPLGKDYTINIEYSTPKEKISAEYIVPVMSYREEREEKLQDFTNRIDKSLVILPKSIMGGVLGFTYLGENYMARRDDLVGSTANMVDVHEAIHTPDEYETRILTTWMLTRERPRYKN